MRASRFFPLLFLAVASPALLAQEFLELDTTHRCIYSGGQMDAELYRFSESEQVNTWVREILELGAATLDFEVVQANVYNVSAVCSGGKRYLLYSLDFVERSRLIEIFGALAHEVGHHANGHTCSESRREIEEVEADDFMGYVMTKKGFPRADIDIFLRNLPSSYSHPAEKRRASVMQGARRAEQAMQIKSLPFQNDPSANSFDQRELAMPYFPWPPPSCKTEHQVPKAIFPQNCNLGAVNQKLRLALDARGYTQRSYFSAPGGFALVTQLEQYNGENANIRNDRTRWLDYPKKENFEGVMDYLRSVVMPQKGHFRLFVFIATNRAFGSSSQRVSKEQATAWLGQGFNKLPSSVAAIPFTEDYEVTAMVYEFVVPESNRKPQQQCPNPLFDAHTHLQKSGLATSLGF